ncbi:zinc finger protein 395a [Solea solea]|uniref:zinc finger protein 395a n=1 Tax=Solea solea TaxID=90069 RepID=UPI002729A30D|nr:zinc finger protein 395a [Solea solea]XP_058485152.1 zinc finger protein 395a [Solea solea]XP_058485153.1 zinc finger protein 395a [Solea solea]
MLPKTRLGKRSPLGALVSSACTAGANPETAKTGVTMATAAGPQAITRVRGHLGLKVYFQCAGKGESPGMADQLDLTESDISAVWPSSHSSSSSSVLPSNSRCVSSCIDVPSRRRSPGDVDMDELMAAMVLSSLSCSPLMHSPTNPEPPAPVMDCVGGELSDSSSSGSGYWSIGQANGSPAPSPPILENDVNLTAVPDEGLDMEMEQEISDEPAPRKRRNSVKVAYRCLWPACGKVLTTVVGIKRHIRTTHLCRGGEHERCSRSEEDFYYTEVTQHQSPPHPPPCSPAPSSPSNCPASPASPSSPSSPSPPFPTCSTLSSSAPSGSFWQVKSEHSYQAPPPSQVITEAASIAASSRWTAPPSTCFNKQALPFRVRSVSVGEQWLQNHSTPCRRIRGEAKKCRKVYGIEHRDQWCTACRWKKACQRFLD